MTINGTWGYKSTDQRFKSTATLLRNLIDIASKGGNYLLNVGPDATGVIPPPEADRLTEIGKWLEGERGGHLRQRADPFPDAPGTDNAAKPDPKGPLAAPLTADWRATTKPGKLFIHLSSGRARRSRCRGSRARSPAPTCWRTGATR